MKRRILLISIVTMLIMIAGISITPVIKSYASAPATPGRNLIDSLMRDAAVTSSNESNSNSNDNKDDIEDVTIDTTEPESESKKNSSDDDNSRDNTDEEKEDAVNRLSRYYHNIELINKEDLTGEQLKKIKELCDIGRNAIAGNDDIRTEQINDIETDTKKNMDDYLALCLKKVPQTTVEYLTVANLYNIPIANYGEVMTVRLPILNLGVADLTNIIVNPVISGSVKEFPFQISRGGFAQEIPRIPGSYSMEQAMAQRAEVAWNFALRDDVLDGYYKLEFDITYMRNGSAETAKLSTYVRCIGAPGSGSVEDGDSGKKSTPRIIVTGFSTEPADVYAGSTFKLFIDVQNVSQRTDVSNIQFDLKASEEGKDNDTTYNSFLPTSGSNTIYVPVLSAGGNTRLEIEMSAKADLVQKPYAIEMSMKYEDEDYESYESSTSISVPIKQQSRVENSTPEVVPESITVGNQSNVMFSIFNTGKTILYNVKVAFEDPAVSGGDAYVGKLESGATGNVDVMVTGEAPGGENGIKGIISYENESGDVTKTEFTIPLIVEEVMMDPMDDYNPTDYPMEPEPERKAPVVPIVIAVICIIAIVVLIVVVKKLKGKEKL